MSKTTCGAPSPDEACEDSGPLDPAKGCLAALVLCLVILTCIGIISGCGLTWRGVAG